jgi:hypothetical protein
VTRATATEPTYWDYIEAALTSLPETHRLRADALLSFDRIKAAVLADSNGCNRQLAKPDGVCPSEATVSTESLSGRSSGSASLADSNGCTSP